MREAMRIFSNRRRLFVILAIPAICLFLFFYQKSSGHFDRLFSQAEAYRTVLAKYETKKSEDNFEELQFDYETAEQVAVAEQVQYLIDYPDYLNRVQEQAVKMQKSSLFGRDPNSFTYRNIIKTAKDFTSLTAEDVRLGNDRAIQFWLTFRAADWLFFGAILLLIMSFQEERQKWLNAIIRSCAGGREKLQVTRLAILFWYSAAMILLLYALPLAVSYAIDGGIEDISRPVQSIVAFQKCTWKLTILEFLATFMLVKIACGFLLGVVMWFCLSFLSRPQLGWLITAGAMIAEYLLYKFIPKQSIFSPFREINVFSYVFSTTLFTQYSNINFLGFPIGRRDFLLILLIAVSILLSFLMVFLLTRRYPFGNRDFLGKWIRIWNICMDAVRRRFSLYGFEAYKLLFLGTGGVFLLCGILLTRNLVCGTTAYYQSIDPVYLQYVSEVQGPVTEDTYDYLQQARKSLETADIETLEFEMALDKLEMKLAELPEGAWILDEAKFMNCYGIRSSTTQRENALYAFLIFTACLSPLFANEQSGDVRKVLRTTARGRSHLFWIKYAVAITAMVFVWFRVFYREGMLSLHYMGTVIADAPSISIPLIQKFPTTVKGTLVILYLYKLLCLVIPVNLCVFVGERCKSFETAFLISTLLLVIPAAAYFFGADWLHILTPASFLADNSPILYGLQNVPIFLTWLALSVLALIAADWNWCKSA